MAVAQHESHLPVIVDPSHAVGKKHLVAPMARAAVAAGADAVMIDVHHDPEAALCDGPQALLPEEMEALGKELVDARRGDGAPGQPPVVGAAGGGFASARSNSRSHSGTDGGASSHQVGRRGGSRARSALRSSACSAARSS